MSTDIDQQIRQIDPAHDIDDDLLDAQGSTASAIRAHALAPADHAVADAAAAPRGRWPAVAAGVAAIAAVGVGAVAVADRRPPETSAEVCDAFGTEWWPNSSPPACADVVIPSIQASIQATGTAHERALVADGVISDEEWEQVNDDLIACLRSGGLDAQLDPHIFLDVTDYGLTWPERDGIDDEQLLRECESQHKPYRIVALYQAQAIGRQEGPRLTPNEVQSILEEDATRFGDTFGPDDPDIPIEPMTPLDVDG